MIYLQEQKRMKYIGICIKYTVPLLINEKYIIAGNTTKIQMQMKTIIFEKFGYILDKFGKLYNTPITNKICVIPTIPIPGYTTNELPRPNKHQYSCNKYCKK